MKQWFAEFTAEVIVRAFLQRFCNEVHLGLAALELLTERLQPSGLQGLVHPRYELCTPHVRQVHPAPGHEAVCRAVRLRVDPCAIQGVEARVHPAPAPFSLTGENTRIVIRQINMSMK